MAISKVYADNGDLSVAKKPGVSTVHIDNMPQGGGGSYTAGNAIDITNDEISVKYDGQTIVQGLVQGTPTDVSVVNATYDPKIEVPSDILTLIKSNDKSEFVINIPANNFRVYVGSGTHDLTVNLFHDPYASMYDTTYKGKATVSVGSNNYLDEQTIIIKCGGGLWGNYSYDTGRLQLVVNGEKLQADSTTLTAPVQFVQMLPGKGPLMVKNPLPSNGTSGQYLKRNETGPVWDNLPAQVNADWNETYTGSKAYIKNKPKIPTLVDLNTAGITDIQQVASLPAEPVSTVLYLIPET